MVCVEPDILCLWEVVGTADTGGRESSEHNVGLSVGPDGTCGHMVRSCAADMTITGLPSGSFVAG